MEVMLASDEGQQDAVKEGDVQLGCPHGVDEFVTSMDVSVELRLAVFGRHRLQGQRDLDEAADEVLTLDDVIGLAFLFEEQEHLNLCS